MSRSRSWPAMRAGARSARSRRGRCPSSTPAGTTTRRSPLAACRSPRSIPRRWNRNSVPGCFSSAKPSTSTGASADSTSSGRGRVPVWPARPSPLAPKPREQRREVSGQRRVESQRLSALRMHEPEPRGVQRLPRKCDGPQRIGAEHVAPFSDERVSSQTRLQANLIALAGPQADFYQRGLDEVLEDAVLRNGLFRLRIAGVRLLLDERLPIPHEVVAPRAGRRFRVTVHDRPVDALRLAPPELVAETRLGRGVLREHNQA